MELVMRRPIQLSTPKLSDAENQLAAGRSEDAINIAKTIIGADPHHVGAWEVLARAQWKASRFTDLLDTINRLISLNPYEPGYFALRGAAAQSLGRLGEAIRDFARAGSACPTSKASIDELRSYQSKLISDLLAMDPVFAAHFAQDPDAACRARGFDLLLDSPAERETWVAASSAVVHSTVRPS